ncbi:MAG: phosphoenolpyruvate carboxylase [Pseudomonadota bacterium]
MSDGLKNPAAATDAALRDDVKLLGNILGSVIRSQSGELVFESIETVRRLSKMGREQGGTQFSAIQSHLAKLSDQDSCQVARGFEHFLTLANIAEQVHRVRRRREFQLDRNAKPQRGSIEAVLLDLSTDGFSSEEIFKTLSEIKVDLVLTAHPTEVVRRTLIKKHNNIAKILLDRGVGQTTAKEHSDLTHALQKEIKSAWLTDEIIRSKPTPLEEARSGLSVIEQTLWRAIPAYCRSLDQASLLHLGKCPPIPFVPISFGSWMGGDRDGNPFVLPEVTREVCFLSRWMAFELYERDLRSLSEELSLSRASSELLHHAKQNREPYRYVIKELLKCIRALRDIDLMKSKYEVVTIDQSVVLSKQEFEQRLLLMFDSLVEISAGDIANGLLYDVIKRFSCFGFCLAKLDLRQESSKHLAALDEVLTQAGMGQYRDMSEEERVQLLSNELRSERPLINSRTKFSESTLAVLDVFKVIEEFGKDAFGSYIISMAGAASDVLAVELLQKEICGRRILKVVPLFETENDLYNSPRIMESLFKNSSYVERMDRKQEIMIGYSDSSKDAGRMAAAWALYKAQESLVSLCKSFEVDLTLFHGRGGTVGRGGGPTYLAIMSQPPGSVDKTLRVTEQGEMIQAKFGIPEIAIRNLDLYVAGTLSASLKKGPAIPKVWSDIMDQLAELSSQEYRQVVYGDAHFQEYFTLATPVNELGSLNIGSRPSRRGGVADIKSLRAIPWIFAWTQTRFMLPVWLGVGRALESKLSSQDRPILLEMAANWPFFQSTLALIEMVLAKADFNIACHYDVNLLPKQSPLMALGEVLRENFRLTQSAVLTAIQSDELLASNSVLKRSIRLRNPYVDPLNLIQVELLKRLRNGDDSASLKEALVISINGISAGMRNTG